MTTMRNVPARALASANVVLGAALLCVGVPRAAQAADPFYERLLTEGIAAHGRGDHVRAAKDLRIAVFGFLDEPPLLARGLCVLAVAQAATHDDEAFSATFLRLAEVESRFQGYSKAEIAPALRTDFERTAARLVPRPTLEATKAFAHLIVLQEEERLAALKTPERRRELQKLIKEQPAEARWRLLLARLELEERRSDEALRWAASVLDRAPDHAEALAVLGVASADKKDWPAAARELRASRRAADHPRTAEAMLRALVALERWPEAAEFAASLAPEVAADKQVKPLVAAVRAAQHRAGKQTPRGSGAAPKTSGPQS